MFSKILKEIESAQTLWKKAFPKKDQDKSHSSVASRFVLLFETHGVHRNQIPRFFGHDLTLIDVEDDKSLLPKLSEEILTDACNMFAVRREWLDGAESRIYQHLDFYKQPEEFITFIEQLKSNVPDGMLDGVLLVPDKKCLGEHALLILEETIGYVGDKEIYRQYICNSPNYKYWKCNAYITSFMAISWKRKVYIKGRYVPNDLIKDYWEGEKLMGWNGDGTFAIKGKFWYPEDMTFSPEEYLKEVDEGLHGKIMGLKAWIDLYDDGFMDSGLNYPTAKHKFLAELDSLKKQIKE